MAKSNTGTEKLRQYVVQQIAKPHHQIPKQLFDEEKGSIKLQYTKDVPNFAASAA